jgi:hypothetical protein
MMQGPNVVQPLSKAIALAGCVGDHGSRDLASVYAKALSETQDGLFTTTRGKRMARPVAPRSHE